MKIIGIAGGSGSGKSTVTYKLVDKYSNTFEILNFDDYQKLKDCKEKLPILHGKINWDHPDVIDWDKLLSHIRTLQSGKTVTIQTWAHRSNPDYFKHREMISRTIYPKKALIVEGYLALWNEDLRKLYDRKYYLNIDNETSIKRRKKFIDSFYDKNILLPMHKKYVEPTKNYADVILDVSKIDENEVFEKIVQDLKKIHLLT